MKTFPFDDPLKGFTQDDIDRLASPEDKAFLIESAKLTGELNKLLKKITD